MARYVRLVEGYYNEGKLVDVDSNYLDQVNVNKPAWKSIYYYTPEHYEQFKKTGTISGITDVITDKLVFDFDAEDQELARKDAVELCTRLTRFGIPKQDLQICFSGGKGFSVEVDIDKTIDPTEFRNINLAIAEGLSTNDPKIYNASRIFRIPETKHEKTGLFKIPLSLDQLKELTYQKIAALAKDRSNVDKIESELRWARVQLPEDIYKLRNYIAKVPTQPIEMLEEFTLENKPKFLSNCRWALQNGFFKSGNRNFALLCLAATYKNQGYNLEMVYRMLKGVAETQAQRNDCERYPDNEIYNNIVLQVFSDTWKGGQFTCREPGNELYSYCNGLGDKKCNHVDLEYKPRTLKDVTGQFEEYVKNIDKNTIKTGIQSLDKKLFISTGMNLGLVGAPSSGKTSVALSTLNHASKAGIKCVFASLDMHSNRLYEKVMYKLSGMDRETLYKVFQSNPEKKQEIVDKLEKEFGNVFFYDRSMPTVADIREYILDCQEQCGEKIKLVMLDYFERVTSDISEDTAASKKIAGELQDLVNDLNIALITLVQPNKMSLGGDASSPIYSYTAIKGSSFLYQSFRSIVSIWRPFFNPKDFSKDKFLQMAILKNDLGELDELSFKWDGKRGDIHEMEDYDYQTLEEWLEEKERENAEDDSWG